MGLSEREKQVLAEMERELFGASKVDTKLPAANSKSKIVAGAALALIGLSLLVTGVVTGLAWIGVVGFVTTLTGVLIASAGPKASGRASSTKATKPKGNVFEDRWNRRSDQ